MDRLPVLTCLQFLVLVILSRNELKGRDLREALRVEGVHKDGPGFYQMMKRLEDGKFIKSKDSSVEINGSTYYEKVYEITAKGKSAVMDFKKFVLKKALSEEG